VIESLVSRKKLAGNPDFNDDGAHALAAGSEGIEDAIDAAGFLNGDDPALVRIIEGNGSD